ncbi:MAG: tetratricopeptide repeat protein [Thermoanaerobaculia bacterium]
MSRPLAIWLGLFGALLCGVTLVIAHLVSVIHISTGESIVAGIITAVGLAVMIRAYTSSGSAAVIVVEVAMVACVWFVYSVFLAGSARAPVKRTMADLRTIATAIEARASDFNAYPPARDIDHLARYLVPTYIKQLPRTDGFRNAFRYESWRTDSRSSGPDHFAVGSAGYDWKWEKRSLRDYAGGATADRDCDIVYRDGAFITYPQELAVGVEMSRPPQTTTDPKTLFEQATTLYRANRYGDAIPLFERYLQTAPDDALANARMGMSLGASGRLNEAIPYLMKASTLDANDYQSRSNLGLVYERLNRAEEGIRWEREADRIKPNDPAVLNNLGHVLLRAGHRAEGIAVLERAVRLAPDNPTYRDNLARAKGNP